MAASRQVLPMLSCDDLERSLRFYGEVLGGVEAYRFPQDGEPAFVSLKLGESEVGLGPVSPTPMHGRPQRPATGSRIELCVYVDDVDAAAEAVRAFGLPVLTEPADQPWGERVAFVEDPDGNVLMLAREAG